MAEGLLQQQQQHGSSRHSRRAVATNLLLLGALQLLHGLRQAGAQQQQVVDRLPSVVELWPAEDGEPVLPAQVDEEQDMVELSPEQRFAGPSGRALHLQPSVLDFGIQQLGTPRVKTLHAYNPSRDTDVFINSVFTASRHFHVSPFQNRVVPASGNVSLRVVFLPTEQGNIESSVFINTSTHGVLPYQVFGVGASETSPDFPERFLGNAQLLFPIFEDIQPSQTQPGATNTSLLQIRLKCDFNNCAHQMPTKTCLSADRSLQLQISLVFRTDKDRRTVEDLKQYILDHIFVVFVAAATSDSSDESAVHIYMLNSGNYLVELQDVHNNFQSEMSVISQPILLLNSASIFSNAASLRCRVVSRDHDASCLGEIRMNLLGQSTPLQACLFHQVTEGFFGLDPSAASFHIQPHYVASGVWSMWLTNNFDFSIVLHNVVVGREARTVLKIVNFTGLLNLPPGCWNVFSLKLSAKDPPSTVFTNVYLSTNLGVRFEIPLQIHSTLTQKGDQHFEAIAQCGKHSYFEKSDAESLRWQKSLSLDHSTWKVDSDLGSELYERYWKTKYGDTCRRHFLLRPKDVWQKKREDGSFAFFWPHLVSKPGLLLNFSTTALKNSTIGFFTLRNPSSSLVAVQLLPLSSYPAPQAALDLLGKWFGINSNSVNFTTDEFRLAKECTVRNENHQDLSIMKPGLEVLHLLLNPWENRRIGVLFTPADNKKVTSLIMIRNNLTILDVVSVEGAGAKESLKVGGRLPGTGGSLRFKVPESTLMDCRQQLKNSKHILSITKIFKVENIGPVPITISSMKINGYTCQGFGFEVLDCHPFFLDQNSSREIGIVFVPDFTSSWVIRELTLMTASDLEFHFTLNVTLPHHLLPLCADGVPGPSWEESFWMLTVLCVSLSLLGVVLIAFQQAQYILTEFMKSRTRQTPVSTLHHNNNSIDAISSDSYRSTCKAFVDSCSPPDKGKGKGFLSVSGTSRNQNASKRSPATYSHSQKKHKCSVYYSKPKTNSPASSTASTPDDKLPQQLADGMPLFPKDLCVDAFQEKWTDLTCANGIDTDLQTPLSRPGSPLEKEELALKNTVLVKRPSLESDLKEDLQKCVFPKETDLRTADNVTELKEPVICNQHSVRKQPEYLLLQNTPPPSPVEPPATPQTNEGPAWQLCSRKEKESCENSKKQRCNNLSVENTVYKAKETKCCGTLDLQLSEHEDALRKKRSPEKRDGNLPSMNWNKNRTSARRNKKKNSNTTARVPEQNELPHLCTEFERPELRAGRLRSWYPAENGNNCKSDHKQGSLPTPGETENFHSSKLSCREKFSSDSSSDCGSSRGSVRASRGSWGSWSSTSSSDGDKRPVNITRNVVPSRDNIFQTEYSVESPVTLNLPPSICSSPDVKTAPHFPEILPPSYTDVAADPEKAKGVYPTEDIWATQPICLANGLNYSIGNNITYMMREHPSVQNSFMDWSGTSDGQFSNMYGHLETNDFGAFHEDNMNYPHPGFPCPEVQSPPYLDHSCPSSWNMSVPAPPPPPPPPQSMPVAWESANYVSSSPYLSSTRSLSPMSGLFGSIWAPQNDMYDGYCPVSPPSPLTDHVENPAVICKQEYSPRFNPFNAYMNLDIWATTANRNATFPLSRDSGYCGNM